MDEALQELLTEADSLASSVGQNMVNIQAGLNPDDDTCTPTWSKSEANAAAANARRLTGIFQRIEGVIQTP